MIRWKTLLTVTLILQLAAVTCYGQRLKLKYNKRDKTVRIDRFVISNITSFDSERSWIGNEGDTMYNKAVIKSTDGACPIVLHEKLSLTQDGYFFNESARQSIESQHKSCQVDKAGSVSFLKCGDKFFITTSEESSLADASGYESKTFINTVGSCFEKIKAHIQQGGR